MPVSPTVCRQSLASLTKCVGNGRVSSVLPTGEASSGGSWYTNLSDARYSGWLLRHKQIYKATPIPPLSIQTRFISSAYLSGLNVQNAPNLVLNGLAIYMYAN